MTPAGASVSTPRLRDLLSSTTAALGSASEARWIVASAASVPVGELAWRQDIAVTAQTSDVVRYMVARRLAGEPLQYVLGSWAFRTLELQVDRRVLIPRPETEQVVTAALDELALQALLGRADPDGSELVVADLGTGSGAIALSLACEFDRRARLEVWATDISAGALEMFARNLHTLSERAPDAAARVRTAQGSWFDALPPALCGRLCLIVSNPPYVSAAEWDALDPVIRDYEPFAALVPGPAGLEAVEVLLQQAARWLAPGGCLVIEIAPAQKTAVMEMAIGLGYANPEVRPDLAGRPRMLMARASRSPNRD
jgi:release factor glutamine methyltransferase